MTQVVGLTGGIASGKSTVSRLLSQVGFPVVDADLIVHRLQQPGQPGFERLVERFGTTILDPNGSLDRQRLGQLAFNDQTARKQLNQVMQPLIRDTIMAQLAQLKDTAVPAIILDAPLLFEQHYDEDCDLIVVVAVDEATQLTRLMERDDLSRPAAQARIAAQLPLAAKLARADVVIDNNGDYNHLRRQVAQLVKRLN
ncbi:dephospho-CoA kinase [Limosilactobacillus antri]|uniref:Dephospho-CoA kinase n=1 Tax=Limosilactobacillus antri DSM 16041 TaxID=525309 RepID=C8P9B9_9LACO|nr:dephospho-CoA kinase [Limosilactobacillus antri]EEW52936.1 dephospho-CoA kinase [Limosilactobacillus antri DSM 16041]KRK59545.1 dephospho-CoA kinase [Limosilactobacillus antri DSM 16041]